MTDYDPNENLIKKVLFQKIPHLPTNSTREQRLHHYLYFQQEDRRAKGRDCNKRERPQRTASLTGRTISQQLLEDAYSTEGM